MFDQDFILNKTFERINTEIPEGTLYSYLDREKKDVSAYEQLRERDLSTDGESFLSAQTLQFFRKLDAPILNAQRKLEQGRAQNLSGAQLQELKKGLQVQILKSVQKLKKSRLESLIRQLDDLEKKHRAGDGLNSTERLLKFHRTQSRINSMTASDAAVYLQKTKDLDFSVDRFVIEAIASPKNKEIFGEANFKKARLILTALPEFGLDRESKKILNEMVQLNESPVGAIPVVKASGEKMTDLNALDLMKFEDPAKPKVEDILNS